MGRSSRNHEPRTRVSAVRWNPRSQNVPVSPRGSFRYYSDIVTNCCLKHWRGSAPLPSPGGKVPQCAHWGGRGTATSGTTFARKQDKSCPNTVLYHALHRKFSDIADPHQSRFARQLPPGGSQGASRKYFDKHQFARTRRSSDKHIS